MFVLFYGSILLFYINAPLRLVLFILLSYCTLFDVTDTPKIPLSSMQQYITDGNFGVTETRTKANWNLGVSEVWVAI